VFIVWGYFDTRYITTVGYTDGVIVTDNIYLKSGTLPTLEIPETLAIKWTFSKLIFVELGLRSIGKSHAGCLSNELCLG